MSEKHEGAGMSGRQFASYLNQLIGRFEDTLEIEDEGKRKERIAKILEAMKEDRNSNM